MVTISINYLRGGAATHVNLARFVKEPKNRKTAKRRDSRLDRRLILAHISSNSAESVAHHPF
jgi:hypothetical protein